MKYYCLLFVCILACKVEKQNIVGKYVSFHSRFDYFTSQLNNESYTIGYSLDVKKDSTFYLETCGNIIEGNWKLLNDSLLLYKNSNKYKIDSLNYITEWKNKLTIKSIKPEIYILKKNILTTKYNFINHNSENEIIINKLRKIED